MGKLLFFVITLISLVSHAEIAKSEYVANIKVNGHLQLSSKDSLVSLVNGQIDVDYSSPNFILSPLKFIRGDRELTLRDKNSEYVFSIPKELITQDGKASVHMKTAKQNAHLNIEESVVFDRSYVESKVISCVYMGSCRTCGIDMESGDYRCSYKFNTQCGGTQKALMKVDLYKRNLNINIYNDQGSAVIKTLDKAVTNQTLIKTLSHCS